MPAPTTAGSNPQSAAQSLPDTLVISATIRDFTPTHPDFEMAPRAGKELAKFPPHGFGLVTGIVQTTLGANGKPVHAGTTDIWTNGKDAFDKWFSNDHPSNATKADYKLTLKKTAQNTYVLDSAADEPFKSRGGFFPIDGELLGNFSNSNHNFHFTLEAHTEFTYKKAKSLDSVETTTSGSSLINS